jgi:hypothetical protein
MFRNITFALAAAAALGTTALAHTSASAWGWQAGYYGSYLWKHQKVTLPLCVLLPDGRCAGGRL